MCTSYFEKHLCSYRVLVDNRWRDGPKRLCGKKVLGNLDRERDRTHCPTSFDKRYGCNGLDTIYEYLHKEGEYCSDHKGGEDRRKAARANLNRARESREDDHDEAEEIAEAERAEGKARNRPSRPWEIK